MAFGYELVGYLASGLVAASLMMSNVRRLRFVNLGGALAFAAYGALVGAWPVLAVNLFIVGVDAWHLYRIALRRDSFTLMSVRGSDPLLRRFLVFYERDIARFFPGFEAESAAESPSIFVLRNMLPVGVFRYEVGAEGELTVLLDYVIPEYRDHQNAEFLYHILNERFGREGYKAFVVTSATGEHARYLARHRFAATGAGTYRRPIL